MYTYTTYILYSGWKRIVLRAEELPSTEVRVYPCNVFIRVASTVILQPNLLLNGAG